MITPLFKPQQWVLYQQENSGGYGAIVGATFDDQGWLYSIKGPELDTTSIAVAELDITHTYENGSWIEMNHETGTSASAYTDQESAS